MLALPRKALAVLVVLAAVAPATAQSPAPTPNAASPQEPAAPTPPPVEPHATPWTFSTWIYTYVVPDDREYIQPTITADRDWLHLEARYNYEAPDSASVFVGWNFSMGTDLTLEITPMLGAVFGETDGIAPAYRGTLAWGKFELASEGEYVIDTGNSSDSFFYNWSELTVAPTDWLRFGVVAQRTRLYQSDHDIQRGLLLGISAKRFDFTGHVFNLDEAQPTYVFSIGWKF